MVQIYQAAPTPQGGIYYLGNAFEDNSGFAPGLAKINRAPSTFNMHSVKKLPRLSRRILRRKFRLAGGPSKGGSHRPRAHGPRFRPGEPVRESGIYEVIHNAGHRAAHEVVMIKGDPFPDCEICRDRVRFRLIRTAPYIFQDADFEE